MAQGPPGDGRHGHAVRRLRPAAVLPALGPAGLPAAVRRACRRRACARRPDAFLRPAAAAAVRPAAVLLRAADAAADDALPGPADELRAGAAVRRARAVRAAAVRRFARSAVLPAAGAAAQAGGGREDPGVHLRPRRGQRRHQRHVQLHRRARRALQLPEAHERGPDLLVLRPGLGQLVRRRPDRLAVVLRGLRPLQRPGHGAAVARVDRRGVGGRPEDAGDDPLAFLPNSLAGEDEDDVPVIGPTRAIQVPGVSSATRGRGSRPCRTASGPEVILEGLLALLHLYWTFIRQKKRFASLQARRDAAWSVAWGPLERGGPSRGGPLPLHRVNVRGHNWRSG